MIFKGIAMISGRSLPLLKKTVKNINQRTQKQETSVNQSFLLLSKKISGRLLPGSITVETALILPIFLFAMLSVMYLTDAIRVSSENTGKLAERAYKYAKYAYVGKAAMKDMPSLDMVEMINGGDDIIDLVKRYHIDVPFDLLDAYDPYAVDRVRVRAFTGYDNKRHGKDDAAAEEMVYVTGYGTVYHRSLGCSHLNFNIRTTDPEHIGKERANDGSKYYPCEYCMAHGGHPSRLYVTDDGNRYHSTLSCGALKRTIKEVPLSETTLPPCSECGGK